MNKKSILYIFVLILIAGIAIIIVEYFTAKSFTSKTVVSTRPDKFTDVVSTKPNNQSVGTSTNILTSTSSPSNQSQVVFDGQLVDHKEGTKLYQINVVRDREGNVQGKVVVEDDTSDAALSRNYFMYDILATYDPTTNTYIATKVFGIEQDL